MQDGRNINQLAPTLLSLGSALNATVPNPMYLKGGTLNVGNPTISRSQSLLPFPQFTSVALNSSDTNRASYLAFYAKVQRRFSSGMTILATYTRARQTDLAYGTVANSFSTAPAGPQNAYDLQAEYGLSTSNMPNRLSTAVTYELPFGKGRKFLSSNRFADIALGGWSANVVGVLQSGYPLAISQPNNNSVFGASTQRPNATGSSPIVNAPFSKRIDGWINPAAFTQAPQFTFGNLSRTISMHGPGTVSWDVSVFKSFQVPEGIKAQFRAEALNVTNTPQFYGPNTTFTSAAFGLITSQANYPRLIQLGVRFTR
ncbi:MAG: hypothetical protein EBY17_16310 [Acidobacteriia bacterium]|nr:hypothetical protein [Terriglobia bacterium]